MLWQHLAPGAPHIANISQGPCALPSDAFQVSCPQPRFWLRLFSEEGKGAARYLGGALSSMGGGPTLAFSGFCSSRARAGMTMLTLLPTPLSSELRDALRGSGIPGSWRSQRPLGPRRREGSPCWILSCFQLWFQLQLCDLCSTHTSSLPGAFPHTPSFQNWELGPLGTLQLLGEPCARPWSQALCV